MKSYTNLEQSKKLAEILPIESADMYWDYDLYEHEDYLMVMDEQFDDTCARAWSLAALLDILPYPTLAQHANGLWSLTAWVGTVEPYSIGEYDNKIDACYEMIIRLHSNQLL